MLDKLMTGIIILCVDNNKTEECETKYISLVSLYSIFILFAMISRENKCFLGIQLRIQFIVLDGSYDTKSTADALYRG